MSTNHTSGPWLLADDGSAFVYAPNRPTESHDWCNRFHARVDAGYDENDQRTQAEEMLANARLIGAAPDLLEALIGLCEFSEAAGFPTERARAAIAKATGATP